MAYNKAEAFGKVLIDLTSDTVTPETLKEGVTAHNAAGEKVTGSMVVQELDILSTKEELEANTTAGKVVDALVVKDINSSLKANNNQIYMDYHDGKYGINTSSSRGADTFIPFRSDLYEFESLAQAGFNQKNSLDYTFTEDYSYALVVCASCNGTETMAVVNISTTAPDYKYLCKDIYSGDVYSRSIRLSLMLIKNVKVGDNIKTSGSLYYSLSQIFGLK